MGIYVGFLAFILISGGVIYSKKGDKQKKDSRFLGVVFLATFLLYSLRASSVGRDLPGYEKAYYDAANYAFLNFDYVYFEKGYVLLMKVGNLLGLSFQWFLTFVNAVILIPVFIFIKKYSYRPLLSVMVYVCYIFFEFNLTGIRQAMASSIVLLGIMALQAKKFPLLRYLFWVFVATLFHKGAYISLIYIPFHFMKKLKTYGWAILGASFLLLIFRTPIMGIIKTLFEKESMDAEAELYIGMNFVFLALCSVLFCVGAIYRERRVKEGRPLFEDESLPERESFAVISDKMFFLSLAVVLLLGADTSARSYMFFNQVILIKLANFIDECIHKESKWYVELILVVFLIIFFFVNTLLPNNFDIVPYQFFW